MAVVAKGRAAAILADIFIGFNAGHLRREY
jgi:hypothetical protein